MLCDVTRCDIASQQGRELQKFYQRRYIVNLSDICYAIKKTLDRRSGPHGLAGDPPTLFCWDRA